MRTILRKFLEWILKEDREDKRAEPEVAEEPERLSYELRRTNQLLDRLGALENYLGVRIQKQYGYKVVKIKKGGGLEGEATAEKAA